MMHTGQRVSGRYRLEEPIGAGGMGVVWRAVDEKLGTHVAVKRGRGSGLGDCLDRRVAHEARIAARMQHPHVVTLLDVVSDGEDRWLVMEYVSAQSLATILAQHGTLPIAEAAAIGVQVADALEAVHAKGVVHRDVKPSNVLVGHDGVVKLADFGIARAMWTDQTATDSWLVGGTPAYLAPEVANGEEPSPAADMFSLGATLYAAVEGRPPFGSDDNPLVILRRAAAGTVPAPERAGPLTPVLAALLDVDPARRPDASRTRQLFGEHAGQLSERTVPAHRKSRHRLHWPVAGGMAVVVTVAVLLATHFSPRSPDARPPTPSPSPSASPSTSTSVPAPARVPAVVGMSDGHAEARLDAAGLQVRHGKAVYDEDHPKGVVVRQRPAAGTTVAEHSTVVLVLSKGAPLRRVPRVVGKSRSAAVHAVHEVGLKATSTDVYDDNAPSGTVVRTSPEAGASVASGTTVRLYVSKGPTPAYCDSLVRRWLPPLARPTCAP